MPLYALLWMWWSPVYGHPLCCWPRMYISHWIWKNIAFFFQKNAKNRAEKKFNETLRDFGLDESFITEKMLSPKNRRPSYPRPRSADYYNGNKDLDVSVEKWKETKDSIDESSNDKDSFQNHSSKSSHCDDNSPSAPGMYVHHMSNTLTANFTISHCMSIAKQILFPNLSRTTIIVLNFVMSSQWMPWYFYAMFLLFVENHSTNLLLHLFSCYVF